MRNPRAWLTLAAVALVLAGIIAVRGGSPGDGAGQTPGAPADSTGATTGPRDNEGKGYVDISPERLWEIMQSEEQRRNYTVVNVHVPYEGHIPGTDRFIPYDRIDQELAQLPGDRSAPIVVYCMSGRMSEIAARRLVDLGYTDVLNLAGGMEAWRRAGYPLENRPPGTGS